MPLSLIKTLWGVEQPISPELFASIRQEGYAGVEVIRLAWQGPEQAVHLVQALNEAGLCLVCQIHTTGGYIMADGEYAYCDAYQVEQHLESFRRQLQECQHLLEQVKSGGFVNVHAGVDAWTAKEAIQFLQTALYLVKDFCFPITFETHRQRLFGSPFTTRDILQAPALQENLHLLNLNADLSHWYCVCERVLDLDAPRDAPWWPNLLNELVAPRVTYIHARFGWAQGPQLADPSAPAHSQDVALQRGVWKRLIMQQIMGSDNQAKIYVCPEYGPLPYMPVHPRTQVPVANLAAAVAYTKDCVVQLYTEAEIDIRRQAHRDKLSPSSSCESQQQNSTNGTTTVPPAAAAVAASPNQDGLLAQRLTVLDQLTNVFAFPSDVAETALDALSTPDGVPDATVCYNFILDQGLAPDQGGPVVPRDDCPHVSSRVLLTTDGLLPLSLFGTTCQYHESTSSSRKGAPKGESMSDGTCPGRENWLCLTCGTIQCSRYVNGHALQHWQETRKKICSSYVDDRGLDHCLAASLSDLSVWCHACEAYVVNPSLRPLMAALERRKFDGPRCVGPRASTNNNNNTE